MTPTFPNLHDLTSSQQLIQTACAWLGQLPEVLGVLYWQKSSNNTFSLQYLQSSIGTEDWDLSILATSLAHPTAICHSFIYERFMAHSIKVWFGQQDFGFILLISATEVFSNVLMLPMMCQFSQVMGAYIRQIEYAKKATTQTNNPLVSQNLLENMGQVKVLLVEDTLAHQIITAKFLKNMGAYVVIAGNSAEATQKVQEDTFDIILMDLQLPDKDGFCTTEAIRMMGYQMPIIALTAEKSEEIQQQAILRGLNGVLSKPIQITELKPTIDKFKEMKPTHTTMEHQPDFKFLTEAANGNQAFFENMLKITITEFEQFDKNFGEAFQQKDIGSLRKLRHKILPHLTSYQLLKIQEAMEHLILLAEQQDWEKAVLPLSEITKGIRKTLQFFRQRLG